MAIFNMSFLDIPITFHPSLLSGKDKNSGRNCIFFTWIVLIRSSKLTGYCLIGK